MIRVSNKRTLLTLPSEISIHIYRLLMWTDVPLYLEYIIEQKSQNQKYCHNQRLASRFITFPLNLRESQRQHVTYWKAANGVCRQLRDLGQRMFFSERLLIMSVACLKAFQSGSEAQDGSVKTISWATTSKDYRSLKELMFANTRQVIVPLMGGSDISQAIQIPLFNTFRNLTSLALRLETVAETDILLDIEYKQGRVYCQQEHPTAHSGPSQPYNAPTELRMLLQQLGFDTTGVTVTLLVADSARGPQAAQGIIDKWEREVYPLLAFKVRSKQRSTSKEHEGA